MSGMNGQMCTTRNVLTDGPNQLLVSAHFGERCGISPSRLRLIFGVHTAVGTGSPTTAKRSHIRLRMALVPVFVANIRHAEHMYSPNKLGDAWVHFQ